MGNTLRYIGSLSIVLLVLSLWSYCIPASSETEMTSIVSGVAYLQGREDVCPTGHAGAYVVLYRAGNVNDSYWTVTCHTGNYTIYDIEPGNYTIRIFMEKYLYTEKHIYVGSGDFLWLPEVTLLGGDINQDTIVDMYDISFMCNYYGSTNDDADINGDGIVDIRDIAIACSNYGTTAPTPWE
jgi:hypothetical protein